MRGGAVVLFQLEQLGLRVVFFEVEDVLDVGAAKGVDALGIVSHHTDILMHGAQLLDDEVLGEVGVLVLVHQDVAEAVLVFVEQIGEVPKQHIHLVQQVVEVHLTRTKASDLILRIDVGQHGAA